jgi:peptide/nickel transport system permease protein
MAGSIPGSDWAEPGPGRAASHTAPPWLAGPLTRAATALVRNRAALAGLLIVGTFLAVGAAADRLPLPSPLRMVPQDRMAGPSWALPLGADVFGRDLLARLVHGARLSLEVAFTSVLAALVAGGALGLLAGYAGGRTDQILMRTMDVFFSFPAVLLALGIVAALGPQPGNVILAIAVVYTPIFARVVRGPVLALKEREFVEASRALGAPAGRIVGRHILPNLA